jgi:hypothetical protein
MKGFDFGFSTRLVKGESEGFFIIFLPFSYIFYGFKIGSVGI